MPKKKSQKPQGLRSRIEKTSQEHYPQDDRTAEDIETFVSPLLEEISNIGPLKKFDLSTAEGARAALPALEERLQELARHKEKVGKLRGLLEEKKFQMENSEAEDELLFSDEDLN